MQAVCVDWARESVYSNKSVYAHIVLGSRGTVGAVCADVAEQVACLLDQAADPAILGRAYGGWEPWV